MRENITAIKTNIARACKEAGRDPESVKVLAATKTVSVGRINQLPPLGITLAGENRVQEFLEKVDTAKSIEWHFIGALQTNKVKYIIDKVDLIHSLDRIELAEEINKRAAKTGRIIECLIEVNIGNELSKGGIVKEKVFDFIRSLEKYNNIRISGIMAVMPDVSGGICEEYYSELRRIYLKAKEIRRGNAEIKYLSAGMSNDYTTAIRYGANIIRLGTAIFGPRI